MKAQYIEYWLYFQMLVIKTSLLSPVLPGILNNTTRVSSFCH